jgi:predicted RNA binding protein with dsRBD fold (UPF0201 family)
VGSNRSSKNKLTKEMLECAHLAATGEYTQAMIAAHLHKSPETIYKWMGDERVLTEFRRILNSQAAASVAKARKVLEKSMQSDAANGYLALNAAQTVLARYDSEVMNKDSQEITITISGGMPDIGMPKRADDD